jgi:hypothetical protein
LLSIHFKFKCPNFQAYNITLWNILLKLHTFRFSYFCMMTSVLLNAIRRFSGKVLLSNLSQNFNSCQ